MNFGWQFHYGEEHEQWQVVDLPHDFQISQPWVEPQHGEKADVQDVAAEVFRSDPEREAIIEEVSRQMQEEVVEPVIPVENKRVMTQLAKLKIKTDNGISISLPRTLADDENSFAVVNNDDGTMSIIISRVQELKTE